MESKKVGLALSGGGYRATLYGLGTLIRLNELGILRSLSRITSVSGGSILNGLLAANWLELQFDENDVATNFDEVITKKMTSFCAETLLSETGMVLGTMNPFSSLPKKIRTTYENELFQKRPFSDIASIPGAPQFLFYGTNMETGVSVRMVDSLLYDYNIGATDIGDWTIAEVVTISGAFPPVLSPITIKMPGAQWAKGKWQMQYDVDSFREVLKLCDGGLYDNLGLECLWQKREFMLEDKDNPWNEILKDDIDVCLSSDAGAPFQDLSDPGSSMAKQIPRIIDILTEQTRALRKRSLMSMYLHKSLGGTYWGITTKIADYEVEGALAMDNKLTESLAEVPTTLTAMRKEDEAHLINWAYALADAAIRQYCADLIVKDSPPAWPNPRYPLN